MSEWWNKKNAIPFDDKAFIKIVKFYQHCCPVIRKNGEHVSCRGIDFKSSGISLNSLIQKMKSNKNNPIYYKLCSSDVDIASEMKKVENKKELEAIVFTENTDLGVTQSIYYYIRNALAHSSFSVKTIKDENYYFFESKKGKTIKAQIRLKESTLLYWIDLFNELSKTKRRRSKSAA